MMTLPVSLVLVATGAILVWGITSDPENLDLDAIGVILMVVGVLGFLLSLLFWDRLRFRRRTYVESAPASRAPTRYPTRSTVVEEEVEEAPPPGPPPP